MAEKTKSNNIGSTIISILVSSGLTTVLVSGIISLQVEKIRADYQEQEIRLEERRFEEEQVARKDQLLNTWIPLLVGSNVDEKQEALAVLFVLFPEDVENILNNVSSSLEGDIIISKAIDNAQELSSSYGNWIIVIAENVNEKEANDWIKLAKEQTFEARRYQLKEILSIAIGPFPTENDAEFALIRIRTNINRGAYPLNLNDICKDLEVQGNITICK